jgi:type VI protein secretion system component Hcp
MPKKKKTTPIKIRDLKTTKDPKGGRPTISDILITKPIDKSTP